MITTGRRGAMRILGAGIAAGALGTLGAPMVARAQSAGYRLGLLTPLSGASEMLGQAIRNGATVTVEKINAEGGVNGRQIELVVRDSKGRPDTATTAAREMIGDGCNLLFGAATSTEALAVSAILGQENAIMISAAAHSLRLTHEDFNRNFFRVTDNPYMRQRAQAKLMAEEYPDVLDWGGLVPDHEYGRSTWDSFTNGLNSYYPAIAGKTPRISPPILCQYGGSDYRNYIAAAMRDPAQGFFNSLYGGDAVTLYQQAKPYGFFQKKKPLVDSANEFMVARAMRSDLPDSWVGTHWYEGAFRGNPISDDLYARLVKLDGNKFPEGFSAEGQAAVLAYVAALGKTGEPETEAVIGALEGLTFDSACGPRTIRAEDHQAIKPVVLTRLRGAKTEDGIEVVDFRVIPGPEVMDAPTPGAPVKWS